LAVANGENSAGGFGITPLIAEELFSMGVDVITTGNHVWDKKEIFDYLPRQPRLLRPANYAPELPGQGLIVRKARNGVDVAVIDLQGRVHMPATDCPFRKADQIIESLDRGRQGQAGGFSRRADQRENGHGLVPERTRLGHARHAYARPTADERILSGGTAYQTDVGMTGPYDSVIGSDKHLALRRFLTAMPIRLDSAKAAPNCTRRSSPSTRLRGTPSAFAAANEDSRMGCTCVEELGFLSLRPPS
jgi:metallophosphoesterase (TIGR00282 family)